MREPVRSNAGGLPLLVAVTGHRDLLAGETGGIRERVRGFLSELARNCPARRVTVLSALAEGADRLVAEEALALGLDLVVPLPMPRALYVEDFASAASRDAFEALCARAVEILELPLARGNRPGDIEAHGPARDRQYAALGVYLCAHCHVLLALWDGKPSERLGGTAQVVRFLHDDVMPGYTDHRSVSHQAMLDDESDLVYHIVCSRDREDGAPVSGLEPLECHWFTKDRDHPRSAALPAQHRLIFSRGNEFSEEIIAFGDSIAAADNSLTNDLEVEPSVFENLRSIDSIFRQADWLAIRYQKLHMRVLRVTYALVFLIGTMFILYSDVETVQYFLYAMIALSVLLVATQYVAKRGAWHRKYLDYRALAEGLRVQFYWAAAGVVSESASKFTHDVFLQSQDPELGWIRNVMRVAGLRSDAAASHDPRGLDFVLREWVGDMSRGQTAYFLRKTADLAKRQKTTSRVSRLALATNFSVIVIATILGDTLPDAVLDAMIALMAATLLLLGVRQGFSSSIAEREVVRQYEYMSRIFSNACHRLGQAQDDRERRHILGGLGKSALNEHAEWILLHRDRSPETGEVWLSGQ